MKILTTRWTRLLGVALIALALAGCDSSEDEGNCDVGFSTQDLVEGNGAEAVLGRTAIVHYEGFLCDASMPDLRGSKFDSSIDRNQPYSFVIGAGNVIDGWDEGVPGMKVGGRRRLIIPPEKGYGSQGVDGVIPSGATLVFDVDLISLN